MRFLEIVSCGRSASRRAGRAPSQGGAQESVPVPASPPPSPTNSPAAAASASAIQKRLHRPGAAAGSPRWRPTLGAIAENVALRAVAAAKQKGGRQRPAPPQAGKAKAAPVVLRAARRRDYLDDHRHFTAPPVIPAFVPAAFLF